MKKYLQFLTIAMTVVMVIFSCSNDNLTATTNENESKGNNLKENEYIVTQTTRNYNSEDLYYKSKFFREVAAQNGMQSRSGVDNISMYDDPDLDSYIKKLYEEATEAEKKLVLKNLNDIDLKIRTSTIVAVDQSTDMNQINEYIQKGEIVSMIDNAFQEEKVIVDNPENIMMNLQSGRGENRISYRATSKYPQSSRGESIEKDKIMNASILAILFLESRNYDSLKELVNKFPKIKLDINKIINKSESLHVKAKGRSLEEYNSTSVMTNKQLEALPHGAIILKKGWGNWFNGTWDHAGLYNRKEAAKGRFVVRRNPCVLTCYPTQSYLSGGALLDDPEFPDAECGQHEPMSNYSFAEEMKVLIPIGQTINLENREFSLGTKAVNSAEKKFYNKGRWGYSNGSIFKDVYSPLIEWNKGIYGEGDCNRSNNVDSDLIYCSRIPWYGYKVNGLDLNADPENDYSAGKGYMIIPDELEKTTASWTRSRQVWGVVGKDDCGNDTYGYKTETYNLYNKTTESYNWKKIPSGFVSKYPD